MRVYTRGVDEGLMIGGTVQVNVLEVQGDCVRLAIVDPDASPSYREEVLYISSDSEDCATNFKSDDYHVCDEEFSFEDEDSRLIPMA